MVKSVPRAECQSLVIFSLLLRSSQAGETTLCLMSRQDEPMEGSQRTLQAGSPVLLL